MIEESNWIVTLVKSSTWTRTLRESPIRIGTLPFIENLLGFGGAVEGLGV